MTFSNSSLLSESQTSIISTKSILIERATKNNLGSQIKIVGFDNQNQTTKEKSFSPRLLNYVEPYEGFSTGIYTTFFTEVNSGLKVGDRVFIINGNYDSDDLIKQNKYKKGRDGYKVLLIDNCKIVLDIKFSGKLPWIESKNDDFIGLYYVQNSQDFRHVNRQITTRGGNFDYKFNYYQNNIIFSDNNYTNIPDWGENGGLTGSPGFYVKNGTFSWTNITSQFRNGSFSIALSSTYSNNARVKVYNGNFTASIGVGVVEFKEGFIYKWDIKPEPDAISGTSSIWIPDVKYNRPFLTKANFRDGKFKGEWNAGLFGRQDKKIKWEGGTAKWRAGTLLNSEWIDGDFEAQNSLTQSWFSELDTNGLPLQKQNRLNNNNRSYNYVIDSEFNKSTIKNGIFINSTIGRVATYSVMEYSILKSSPTFSINVERASFENCNFLYGKVNNSEIVNCKSLNTEFQKVKSINSDYKLSVIKESTYISDEIVKIIGYDEFIMSASSNIVGPSHKVFKFYITEKNYHRFKNRDRFYIKGLKLFNDVKYPLHLFDRRFRIGTWTEYIDFYSGDLTNLPSGVQPETFYKRGIEVGAFLSTPEENAWKFTTLTPDSMILVGTQSEKRYSVDVVFSIYDKNGQKVEFSNDQNTYDIQNSGLNFNYDQTSSPSSTSPTMPNFIGNILDISSAYILESDFESGIIESSDWNNGYHINYNNDVNITQNTNEGKFYNLLIQTSSLTLLATTTFDENFVEAGENCLNAGNVVFLNAVDYDTRGKVKDFIIIASGSNYISSPAIPTTGTFGQGFNVDIVADTIGEVLSITYSIPTGGGYPSDGTFTTTTLPGGSGQDLEITYIVSGGSVISATISNGGTGYLVGEEIQIDSATTTGTFSITKVSVGNLISATINTSGIKYNIGDQLLVNAGDGNAILQITAVTGSITRIPEYWKIIDNLNGQITLKEITSTASILSSLLDDGLFYTVDANNRYGYIYKAFINKTKIKSGVFRRAFIKNSLIEDINYDLQDRDFSNMLRIKNLLLSDILFNNNGNILSNATYMNSNFTTGSDSFRKGIVYNSVWNGPTFSDGIFEYGTWLDGLFTGGTFYENRSFNANPGTYSEFYDKNNYWLYVRDGLTTATISNTRVSWHTGTFSAGNFFKSDWENGQFTDGKFYFSKWYNGNFYGGIIGDNSVQVNETQIYNGTIWNATVENARLYAVDSSLYGLSNSTINWYDGIFNSGVFGSDIIQTTASHTASWWNGNFNGGEFITNAKWKNGKFNGGKFKTKFGWLNSTSTSQSDYGWENGIFNGGEFGVGDIFYSNYKNFYDNGNSTWYTGEFNGGVFRGRVWNDGIFVAGSFEGSGTISVVSALGTTAANADQFSYNFRESGLLLPEYKVADGVTEMIYTSGNRVWYEGILWECATSSIETTTPSATYSFNIINLDQYRARYHGLWRNGIVTNIRDRFIVDQRLFTQPRRSSSTTNTSNRALLSNIVWQNGVFSHNNGVMKNSIWWSGVFESGQFNSSSFNPYVRRNSTRRRFNLNDNICYWNNGFLVDSDFYISKWNEGTFISGTGYGMIFKGGVSNYMNAFNVFWENGIWRNGNWYGSYFDVVGNGEVTEDYVKQILFRGMSWSGTSSVHGWNILIEQNVSDSNFVNGETASSIIYQPNPLLAIQPPQPVTQIN